MSNIPPVASIPNLTLHDGLKKDDIDASKIVHAWLSSLQQLSEQHNWSKLSTLFLEDCWWRDFASLSWDITSKGGIQAIQKYLSTSTLGLTRLKAVKDGHPLLQPQVMDMGGMIFVQSVFTFENKFGQGRGVVRLVNVGLSEWKAWIVFTELKKLNGQKDILMQQLAATPPPNVGVSSAALNGHKTSTVPEDLQVLVIGAGQSGLSLAAYLKNLGIKYLVVDKAPRIAEAWRRRYESVRSHTPTYGDHFPFLKYPADWPLWLEKNDIIKWMDHYAATLDLEILLNTAVTSTDWDASAKQYSVQVELSTGEKKTIRTNHLVMATGLFANAAINRPTFPGEDLFKGQIYHSSLHRSAVQIPDLSQKNVLVVGASVSGHDIATDFVNKGAKSVSLLQRHPIWSVSSKSTQQLECATWNPELGLDIEDGDLFANSFPTTVGRAMARGWAPVIQQNDGEMLEGLERAGMLLRKGEDGISVLDHQLILGGHYYIDQGAWPMIIDGRIKIVRDDDGVKEFYADGAILGDGRKLQVDVVVLATGYQRNKMDVEELMGSKVIQKLDKIGDFGRLDEGQERIGWWRPTGVPGFWFMTGAFTWARQFAGLLAMQISAVETGANDGYYN